MASSYIVKNIDTRTLVETDIDKCKLCELIARSAIVEHKKTLIEKKLDELEKKDEDLALEIDFLNDKLEEAIEDKSFIDAVISNYELDSEDESFSEFPDLEYVSHLESEKSFHVESEK